MRWMVLVVLAGMVFGCSTVSRRSIEDIESADRIIDLAGDWTVSLDPEDIGQSQKWYERPLDSDQTLHLPGSLQAQGYGNNVSAETQWTLSMWNKGWQEEEKYKKHLQGNDIKVPFCLQPVKHYIGKAWYSRAFDIPAEYGGKKVTLTLERSHWEANVWIDGKPAGTANSLCTPNRFEISRLKAGTHRITICIDNTMKINVGTDAHSVTDHTQTNWNGIIGAIQLQPRGRLVMDDVQVYPDIETKQALVRGTILNKSDTATKAKITLDAKTIHGRRHDPDSISKPIDLSPGKNHFEMTYDMGQACVLWDEFAPNVYEMKASINADDLEDTKTVSFGMRQFRAEGTQFTINGRKIFLRGTLECCIFPLTGYPPTDVQAWERIIKIAQSHGLNHFRFHSWCPPKAAFEAADKLGFYFQVEGPVWGTVGDGQPVDDYIYTECERILKEYGNHPSFVMMAYGNEPWGDNHEAYLNKLVKHLKSIDARHLYTAASGWAHVPQNQYHSDYKPRVQLWNANLTSRINALPPETVTDYRDFVAESTVPIVSHEIGQWCAYPNYKEMEKYTGVVKPKNFEIFRQMLKDNHMLDQADDFLMASGKLQVLCYKEDIESALRTPGFGGFQLLDLHDFPGQGTALVGVLDPFWDPKPYVNADQYRRFCGQTVPLARIQKRVWTEDETFAADLEIAHFGPKPIEDATVSWKITEGDKIYASGKITDQTIAIGNGIKLAPITASLQDVKAPAMLNLEVAIDGTEFVNDWDVWVYPKTPGPESPDITIVNTFDDQARAMLESGQTVMLMPAPGTVKGNVPPGFSSIFWNTLWTNGQQPHTLGILCDPQHPALADFPTQYHSNWQWWDIITRSQAMVMDDLPPTLRPIVQVIDDWFSNRRLGIVFEARVNGSKLLICSVDLQTDIEKRPVAKQLLYSLKNYMNSEAFDPKQQLTPAQVNGLFRSGTPMTIISADSQAPGYPASNAVDEDPKTFWHTPWVDEPIPYPHELIIDLKASRSVKGIHYRTRQDGLLTGCVKEYEVYLSDQPDQWGDPADQGSFIKNNQRQTVLFDKPQAGRYLRFVAAGSFDDSAYAAVAELEVITEQE